MFPQEVDVINIALILPVFSAAVVKTTPVWVLCVLGNSRGGGWLDGGGQRYACECVRACRCMCVGYMRTIGMVFTAQPRWADVMLGSIVVGSSSSKVSCHLKSQQDAIIMAEALSEQQIDIIGHNICVTCWTKLDRKFKGLTCKFKL